ncbi:MAG: family 43 glycosylhydrolase [Planctomyces sp.]|nr:family 43 glycosylhydrolase [Planctomyces sp.]
MQLLIIPFLILVLTTSLALGQDDTLRDRSEDSESLPPTQFVNPVAEGADPWVIRDPYANRYLWCMSEGNRAISVWTSPTLTSLGERHVIWKTPQTGPYSKEVWAPELHLIDERWYVYFAASDGKNENHLAWVLQSETSDVLGKWTLHGPFATGDGSDGKSPNIWAIDMTVLEHNGARFAIWSGWDAPGTDRQYLYIAPMKSPTELSGPRVQICNNADFLWERTEETPESRGLHEGPQVLQHNGRTFVLYSTAASWLPTYKLGMLELTGDNPLDPKSWKKSKEPVFQSTETTYGVGHSCFLKAENDQTWWHIFHAKQDRNPGWRRAIYVQPMEFQPDGTPEFGVPVAPGRPIPSPPSLSQRVLEFPFELSLRSPTPLDGWSYLGHQQLLMQDGDGVHLGVRPQTPVNVYRSGEKLVLNDVVLNNFTASVSILFQEGERDAGILFRVSAPAVGYDSQRGYFAGIIPHSQLAVLGRMDGHSWKELARAHVDFDPAKSQQLSVSCIDDRITVRLNGNAVLEHQDGTYSRGTAGIRVVDTHAVFSDFILE